ncbi:MULTISPECIES: hypothetical protein [Roseobacteraceae]|uniref:Uncharacterized protein n=1 Tax=Pseudosulfitobacter pseudonitzschiae TaxID=1402135 RepID=A0A221JXU2_9RHOB|nr:MULTISPECIES: hypothetical protein [Roseobacteraceae]ASM71417.1 hypothetical protein SULPSESMR1_00583 [Pseudosulfitobacter pseudonitzschiae]
MKSLTTLGLSLLAAPVAAHTDAGLHLHPHVSDGAGAWVPVVLGMVAIAAAIALTAGRAAIRARNQNKSRK